MPHAFFSAGVSAPDRGRVSAGQRLAEALQAASPGRGFRFVGGEFQRRRERKGVDYRGRDGGGTPLGEVGLKRKSLLRGILMEQLPGPEP